MTKEQQQHSSFYGDVTATIGIVRVCGVGRVTLFTMYTVPNPVIQVTPSGMHAFIVIVQVPSTAPQSGNCIWPATTVGKVNVPSCVTTIWRGGGFAAMGNTSMA
jgi:hypothetical protein